jgi:hypothetical protein
MKLALKLIPSSFTRNLRVQKLPSAVLTLQVVTASSPLGFISKLKLRLALI